MGELALLVLGDSPDDFALALAWDRMFGRGRWLPEASIPGGALTGTMAHLVGDMSGADLDVEHTVIVTSASLPSQATRDAAEWVARQGSGWSMVLTQDHHDATREPVGRGGQAGAEIQEGESDSASDPWAATSITQVRTADPVVLDWSHPRHLAVRDHFDLPLALPAEISDEGDLRLLIDLPPTMPDPSVLSTVKEPLTWQIELRVDHPSPRARGLNPHALQERRGCPQLVRASRDGQSVCSRNFGLVMSGETPIQQLALPRVRLPGLLSWVRTMAAEDDLRAEFSTPGHRVEILRRRWGSRPALASDWSGYLRPVLLAFCRTGNSSRDAYPDGEGVLLSSAGGLLSFDGMVHVLHAASLSVQVPPQALRDDIDRLTALGVFTRGLILECASCSNIAFVSLDQAARINTCLRCGADNDLVSSRWTPPRAPFTPEPTFFYDLHQAARDLVGEDSGVALLLSHHLQAKAASYEDLSEIEFYADGKAVAEVDLIACRDNRVIIAEAKKTPTVGTKPERTAKAAKMARVARALLADEVILCTSSSDAWKRSDVDAVTAALRVSFGDRASVPTVRTVCGLGSDSVQDSAPPVKTGL